ncbi:3-dehydroquinate synthase [soil metagenome]
MSRTLYRIPVTTASHGSAAGYEILVAPSVWGSLPSVIERCCLAHRYAVITDHHVAELYGSRLLRALHSAGHRADIFVFPAGEEQKTVRTWEAISDAMLEAGMGRDTAVVALGGGVAGDIAGFVAATHMRGVPVVQVPTTLLAMIDASVGGKTGVNAARGKNLLGAFHPPRAVIVDPEVLRTLPVEHLRRGLAEAVKHGAIADAEHLADIEATADALLLADPEALGRVIVRSVEIKAGFVGRDERENGPRKALNFGHTIGHALESLSGYRLMHGEAVAMGMVAEARIGEQCGVTEPGTAQRLRGVLCGLGLPTAIPPEVSVSAVLEHTRSDKKARNGRVEYTLIRRIGVVNEAGERWAHPVADETVRAALCTTQ